MDNVQFPNGQRAPITDYAALLGVSVETARAALVACNVPQSRGLFTLRVPSESALVVDYVQREKKRAAITDRKLTRIIE